MSIESTDKKAPMASAPMKYLSDGSVDWGNMWDTFCVLARDGGPAHRATLLQAQEHDDPHSAEYRFVAAEICRAIPTVSGLTAEPARTGWIAVRCPNGEMAQWLSESIVQEGVDARCEGKAVLVPCGANFTLKGEIKNVVTAVAKTTHYWADHLPPDVKYALQLQSRIAAVRSRISGWLRR
jgi:sirohydrochlorin cobaltochelatase